MGQIIEYWVTVKAISQQMPSNSHTAWNPDGQSFTLTWGWIRGQIIELELFWVQIVKEAQWLTQGFHNIILGLEISLFELSQLQDVPNVGSASLFDIDENIKVFQIYIDKIWEYLGKNDMSSLGSIFNLAGKIHWEKGKEFLSKSSNRSSHIF